MKCSGHISHRSIEEFFHSLISFVFFHIFLVLDTLLVVFWFRASLTNWVPFGAPSSVTVNFLAFYTDIAPHRIAPFNGKLTTVVQYPSPDL